MDEKVENLVRDTLLAILSDTAAEQNIAKSFAKHEGKIHFVPVQYRVLGGLMQSLNIKFGNFIEKLIAGVVSVDGKVTVLPYSGKQVPLVMTAQTDQLIDQYITNRQLPDSPDDCEEDFEILLQQIIRIEGDTTLPKQKRIKDVDVLFQTSDGTNIYLEVKYNDDHDTGKFEDINRKFLKTYAGLVNQLQITDPSNLIPVIYYFNPTKRWGPIYTPTSHIYRGRQLFEQFFDTPFEDIDNYLKHMGNDPKIVAIFDDLYQRIRNHNI